MNLNLSQMDEVVTVFWSAEVVSHFMFFQKKETVVEVKKSKIYGAQLNIEPIL